MTGHHLPSYRPYRDHILPFLAWLVLLGLLPSGGWSYVARWVTCLVLLAWCRPWRYYRLSLGPYLPLALATGAGVFLLWILPELQFWEELWPQWAQTYKQFAILPPWEPSDTTTASTYDYEGAGGLLRTLRLMGSVAVIAPIEEFFWRGFLYRWLISKDFLNIDLGRFRAVPLIMTTFLFGLEHDRWLAGIAAGAAYGFLMLRTRNIGPPIMAHVTTNCLLGLYVLLTGAYGFW